VGTSAVFHTINKSMPLPLSSSLAPPSAAVPALRFAACSLFCCALEDALVDEHTTRAVLALLHLYDAATLRCALLPLLSVASSLHLSVSPSVL
jgi:hypothetical protein